MGEAQKEHGVSRLTGVDIIPEAYEATVRDRPGLYDAYYVEDFTTLDEEKREDVASRQCDCMVTVANLGFADIPTNAFIEAVNIINMNVDISITGSHHTVHENHHRSTANANSIAEQAGAD